MSYPTHSVYQDKNGEPVPLLDGGHGGPMISPLTSPWYGSYPHLFPKGIGFPYRH